MSNSLRSLPLQERITHHSVLERLTDLVILFLLIALLVYRFAFFRNQGCSFVSLLAFICESWFTFYWLLIINGKWNPVSYKTYPERLLNRFKELPAVDIFITTADPMLEPPIITANTMISLLSVEYPTNRLACYVSDDGGSLITYYAIREASKFAKVWVPFCKKYNVQVRAPFVYFSTELQQAATLSKEFVQEWKDMKREYLELCGKVEGAAKNAGAYQNHMKEEFLEFSVVEKGNHPSIIKVISENKGEDDIPHVIYVAREKRPKHPHHYKAGAMNVLTRVSGVMTNAPFILNVDCDMFANNPEVILHSMCLMLGFDDEISSGFVQAYQQFYGALKDDPFGNQLVVLFRKMGRGMGGLQGATYAGTGCFHRRKIIYGASPDAYLNQREELTYKQLHKTYGNSKELTESVTKITTRKPFKVQANYINLSSIIPTAVEIASCTYELNTSWGQSIGWIYGSVTEDVLTGLRIHARGWRSKFLTPEPPAFLGDAPTSGPASLTQYKRWSTGLLEILLGRNTPIHAFIYEKLWFRQCLVYLWLTTWALCGVMEFCYALLPAYCFITNSSFLPEASSVEFYIPFTVFTLYNISTLSDFLECRLTFRAWWNNQRMSRIHSASSFLFGFLSVFLKKLGLSETIFEVTKKDQKDSSADANENANADLGRFTFDSSAIFVPATALLLVHIACLAIAAIHYLKGNEHCWGVGEVVCSLWLIVSFWPFVRGLYGKGIYGIPWSVIWKALGLSWGFIQLCGPRKVH